MSKRILSLVLALVMVLGTFGTVFAAEPSGNAKVDWLVENGKVQGYGDGTLGLDKAITRAEVATMVIRALGLESEAKQMENVQSVFPDMRGTNVKWANGYVNVAVGKGIINGYEDGTFKPSKDITYAEVASILVKALKGMTEAEIKSATGFGWASIYLVKAAELGVLEGVEIADFNAKAVRATIFEMFYNTIVKGFGNYTIVKGIVLENNRVESIKDNQVVVEIIKEIQTAEYAKVSRTKKGDQIKLELDAKVADADVEYLLGKVVDFALDKDGKVVKVTVDTTYDYFQGKVKATKNKIVVDGKTYTVELDERYKEKDERIFRTYLNDTAVTYEDFYQDIATAKDRARKDEYKADFAKVTVKNGKVLFVDAFAFDDIAPVQEVKRDSFDVYVYNDYRDGRIEKFEPRALVVGFKDGRFSRIERKDIKAEDVVHVYKNNRMIVRMDAKVEGTYQKVERNRDDEYYVHIDEVAYMINEKDYRKPVYAHDSKAFTTLFAANASKDLSFFYKEKVSALKDINDDLQLFGANVVYNEGFAVIKQVLAKGQVKFVKGDDKDLILDEDYSTKISVVNLGTGKTTINQRLAAFNTLDLTFVKGDEAKIDSLVRIASIEEMKVAKKELKSHKDTDLNNSFIRTKNDFRYQVLDRTNVFVIDTEKGTVKGSTVKDVQKSLIADKKVEAYILSDLDVWALADTKVINDRNRITKENNVAHTIVFIDIQAENATDDEIVLVTNVYTARKPHYIVGQLADNAGKAKVERTAEKDYDLSFVNPDDIVSLLLTKNDDKLVTRVETLIKASDVKTESYRVVGGDLNYSNSEYRRLSLRDANNAPTEKWIIRNAKEFGTITIDSVVTFKTDKNGDISVLRVYSKNTPVTKNSVPGADKTDLVTYINPLATRMVVNEKVYVLDEDTVVYNSNKAVLAIGSKAIAANATLLEGFRVKDILVNRDGVVVSLVRVVYVAPTIDKSLLNAAIVLADAEVEALNTPATWGPFAVARTNAKAVYADVNATQAQIDAAKDVLVARRAELVKLAVVTEVKWEVEPAYVVIRTQGKLKISADLVGKVVVKNNGVAIVLEADGSFKIPASGMISNLTVEVNGVADATLSRTVYTI